MNTIYRIVASALLIFMVSMPFTAHAGGVNLSDYMVIPSPGDSWTYADTFNVPPGPDVTVTEHWYLGLISWYPGAIFPILPELVATGLPYPLEPYINQYHDLVSTITVPAGTFNNVLLVASLDEKFPANSKNTELGIDIDQGVTDVDWIAPGVGIIKSMGVDAATGDSNSGYELKNYTLNPVVAPNLHISPATGRISTTQKFDLTLIVETRGHSITGGQAILDEADITTALKGCVIPGTTPPDGETLRCPNLSGLFLGAGMHQFSVNLDLSNGSTISDTVIWEVRDNAEVP